MSSIHPTAIVSPEAKIGENVTISPFAIIQDDVEIGDGTFIGPSVCVYNGARIGNNVKIFQGASVAHRPQDLKFKDEQTFVYVGDNTTIHEFVTLHRGTEATRMTKVGKNVLLMAYSHIAHDTTIGDNCILANGVQIAGHVHVDDWAIIGGLSPVHQFCNVGKHVMIGGGFRAVQDVPPFILCAGEPLRFEGLNVVGLRRRGFSREQIELLKKVYNVIYSSHYNITQAKEKILNEFPPDPLIDDVLGFIAKSKRGLIGKKLGHQEV
ncbi:MAG: acyl-ACP--UDP-N-acetylglucosamine O-acyltransferase [Ignavibacteriaceae bacterium]|nr:acyl-ACP--UDP-N-acetylglucosamine O-acyltransferase [Ignavibacteriaceae bacterium]